MRRMRDETRLEDRYEDCTMVGSLSLDPIGGRREERQHGVVRAVNCGQERPDLDTGVNA